MKKIWTVLKKELMLTLALLAAIVSLFITPPTLSLFKNLDWRTLGILLMMLSVLEGFKKENVLSPVIRLASRLHTMVALSLFVIFGVFFTSMFVTNDVSLIIFVPLTILLFRSADKEKYILPVISMENIAAIRGSLLTPFGSPQNLFLYGQADVTVWRFLLHMSPMMGMSAVLLVIFVLVLYRKDLKEEAVAAGVAQSMKTASSQEMASSSGITCNRPSSAMPDSDLPTAVCPKESPRGRIYLALFVLVLLVIVTRTSLWYWAVGIVVLGIFFTDRTIFKKVDYVLLLTFLCFFIFSSSIAANPGISAFLKEAVAGREYWWAIGLSQIISNVPASIVLYPFTENFAGLIYGADTAGLVSLIGSLASVINYRIYVREYPGNGWQFVKVFTLISWAFFAIVVVPGYLLSFWSFF